MDEERDERQRNFEDEDYERRRRARARRRYLEKKRQIRRRKMMRLLSLAAMLVLTISLVGRGVYKVLSRDGKKVPTKISTEVKAGTENGEDQIGKGEIQAQKQPVMSAADIAKMSSDTTLFGWQEDKHGKWYRSADGTFYENGWREIDGAKYYFNHDGYVHTGWLELDGKDYWFGDDGKYDASVIRPMIALTYDDGPGEYTEELLDCLEANNAKATFYMLGQNVKNYPEVVERMKNSGMELGNHTYSHENLTSLDINGIKSQIGKTDAALEDAAGEPSASVRPPGGSYNETVQNTVGHPIIKWSIDTKDWATRSADNTYKVVLDNVQNGSIVLMHDIHEPSVQASLRMIPDLVEKGFKLVTVQELAKARGIDLEDGKVYYYMGDGTQQVE